MGVVASRPAPGEEPEMAKNPYQVSAAGRRGLRPRPTDPDEAFVSVRIADPQDGEVVERTWSKVVTKNVSWEIAQAILEAAGDLDDDDPAAAEMAVGDQSPPTD